MKCECCSGEHDGSFGTGRFCSRMCANSRERTEDIKKRVSHKLTGRVTGKAYVGYKVCEECHATFAVNSKTKNNRFCSPACANVSRTKKGRINGLKSAATVVKRSKNEIMFASLCEEYFLTVRTNLPVFNGWDADVIIEDVKVAVLWNGVWHHKKIKHNHSVCQVQNRDKIKVAEIVRAGYIPYTINDYGSHNELFVRQEFEKFKAWIGELAITEPS